jgi:two-component system, NarL family, response regulator DesR
VTSGREGAAKGECPLTPRQLAILRLLAQGKTTSQISDELVLSSTTVRNHIAHLLASLGTHSRLEAVIVAQRKGLIDHL